MDIQKKFKSMISPAVDQIQERFNNDVQELNDYKIKIREVMSLIKKELIDALESTAHLKPGRKNWEIIMDENKKFLDMQSRFILVNLKDKCPEEKFKHYEHLLTELKEEIEAEIETYINGHINYIVKRRRAILYDLLKILLGTTAGALTAYYLQYYIF